MNDVPAKEEVLHQKGLSPWSLERDFRYRKGHHDCQILDTKCDIFSLNVPENEVLKYTCMFHHYILFTDFL